MRFDDPDFVLISSHAFAHHADWRNRSNAPRFVYVHTPARYIWAPDMDARGNGLGARGLSPLFKHLDRRAAKQDACYAANSEFVRERIRNSWDRDANVIYPPVRVAEIQARGCWADQLDGKEEQLFASLPDSFILGASRFVPYKRLDAVIDAGEAVGLPVVLAGNGPQRQELEERAAAARVPVKFILGPSDTMLFALYQAASVFVFPAVEDFGIMPVEAMAVGTPVVVQHHGGAKESVEALKGGAVLEGISKASLKSAIDGALMVDMRAVPATALGMFDTATFGSELRRWITGIATSTQREALASPVTERADELQRGLGDRG
jgi:glycosyltransferase involved in cell wall biosynthesis